ncbi:MAG: HAD family hydrolase [Gammaproteobacteria bacterium]
MRQLPTSGFYRQAAGAVLLTLLFGCSPADDGGPRTDAAAAPQSPAARPQPAVAADPLPSWNDGATKQQILDFVARVTDPGNPDFVPADERIATFDNDGTLWSEQPLYFQLLFARDRVLAMAAEHPEWREEQPFKAVLEDDKATLATFGLRELGQIMMATHAGLTVSEFSLIARQWLDTARHPRFDRPFDRVIYQPMLEVLAYLRANGFKTFIVSGGGIEFIRTFAEDAYGIPPDQVVGSSIVTEFRTDADRSFLVKLPELNFNDDKEGKPVAINLHIGQRPIAAFGNSDGDLQMLQYAAGGETASLAVFVHHDDGEREYAYDRESHIGRLDKGLDEAAERGWTVISMRDDWASIFPDK